MQATFDVKLLDSTYTVEQKHDAEGKDQSEVIVKLFGKTRENKSITILCPDFKPYFHVFEPSPELRKALESSNDVLKVEDVKLEYKGAQENFAKVTVRAPWLVPKFRGLYELKNKTIILHHPPEEVVDKIKAEPDV